MIVADYNEAKTMCSLRGMKISNYLDGRLATITMGEDSGSWSGSIETNKDILNVL